MNRAVLATALAALLLGVTGCGTGNGNSLNPPPTPKSDASLIHWDSDGNPLVLVCGADLANCKTSFTVHDITLSTDTILPISSTSYLSPNPSDSYEVRVNGYDWQGLPISSPYGAVPKP